MTNLSPTSFALGWRAVPILVLSFSDANEDFPPPKVCLELSGNLSQMRNSFTANVMPTEPFPVAVKDTVKPLLAELTLAVNFMVPGYMEWTSDSSFLGLLYSTGAPPTPSFVSP
ncbi:hypothetical protein BC830DRAFT_1093306 [Chytriomyces sp. MP71]|nr:hypothetical protein BC830DRAFT_1093306 [Chytriomyces sp. MP71]